MYRIIFIILLAMVLAQPVYGQMLQVEEMRADVGGATLRDQETGDKWEVKVGDAVGNWRVFKIEPEGVTIGKWGDKGEVVSTKLPAKKRPGAVMPRPK